MKAKIRGFSLIELMVVIAIVAVLSAIAVPAYRVFSTKARIASAVKMLNNLKAASVSYYNKNGAWPSSITQLGVANTDSLDTTLITSVDVCPTGCLGAIGTFDYSGQYGVYFRLNPAQLNLPATATNPTLVFTAVENDGTVTWTCTTDAFVFSAAQNIAAQYLPKGCVSPD